VDFRLRFADGQQWLKSRIVPVLDAVDDVGILECSVCRHRIRVCIRPLQGRGNDQSHGLAAAELLFRSSDLVQRRKWVGRQHLCLEVDQVGGGDLGRLRVCGAQTKHESQGEDRLHTLPR
jgi:hypothetical protein